MHVIEKDYPYKSNICLEGIDVIKLVMLSFLYLYKCTFTFMSEVVTYYSVHGLLRANTDTVRLKSLIADAWYDVSVSLILAILIT